MNIICCTKNEYVIIKYFNQHNNLFRILMNGLLILINNKKDYPIIIDNKISHRYILNFDHIMLIWMDCTKNFKIILFFKSNLEKIKKKSKEHQIFII